MEQLKRGMYYGEINRKFVVNELLVSDAVYTLERVDWHYHENPYFTFILEGNLLEGNKQGLYDCTTGDLLFHNWQDPHYNIKPEGCTRGFHIELSPDWILKDSLNLNGLEGNIAIKHPEARLLFHQLFSASFIQDNASQMVMESLLLNVFAVLNADCRGVESKIPKWVWTLRDYLRENYNAVLDLSTIANMLDLHPVYLSREFSRYFGTTMGVYIRKLKVEKALLLLDQRSLSLTEIAYHSGFADQSHFIRCFKACMHVTPKEYRKMRLS